MAFDATKRKKIYPLFNQNGSVRKIEEDLKPDVLWTEGGNSTGPGAKNRHFQHLSLEAS